VLLALGAEHALVVHSRDGLDEISVSAPTHICELREGTLRSYEFSPEELLPIEEIAGGDSKTNAAIAHSILTGKRGAPQEIVALNAGAALYVAGEAPSIRDGMSLARQAITSGRAKTKLEELIAASRSVA